MSIKTAAQKLLNAYTNMLERVKQSLDTIEDKTNSAVFHAIEEAKKTAEEIGELTREDAEIISLYLKRDIKSAGKFLNETGKELADWLAFDYHLIEEKTWETFLSVADKTKVEWLLFEKQLELGKHYHTGEITAAGTLYCTNCSQNVNFYQIVHIPPCPKCQGTEFIREKH